MIDGKGASDHGQDRIDGNRRASKLYLGQEMVLDAGTEWRVKWSQRGMGTFGFLGILSYIVGWSMSNNIFKDLDDSKKHENQFNSIVKILFTARRKMIKTSLKSIIDESGLTGLNIDPKSRPELLNLDNFLDISRNV